MVPLEIQLFSLKSVTKREAFISYGHANDLYHNHHLKLLDLGPCRNNSVGISRANITLPSL